MLSRACGVEGEALGDGGELVAGADPVGAEARLEDAPDGGDEAGAAGEEDAVHLHRRDAGGGAQAVDGGGDGGELIGDPTLEVGTGDAGAEAVVAGGSELREVEVGGLGVGELHLEALDGLVELVAQVVVDEGDEGGDLVRLLGAQPGGLEQLGDVAGLEKGEVVPAPSGKCG